MTTKRVQRVFNCIWCFNGTFPLQEKTGWQTIPDGQGHMAKVLQWPFKEELLCVQQQDIIRPLGIGETAE